MKKIYFYSTLIGFTLGLLALFMSVSDPVTNFLNRLGTTFNFNGDINGFVAVLIYLTILVLPLVIIFFLITSILWKFAPVFKNKYKFLTVLKINLFFIIGVLISVSILFFLSLSVTGA